MVADFDQKDSVACEKMSKEEYLDHILYNYIMAGDLPKPDYAQES